MDIFSHGLWSGAIAKGANKFKQTRLSPWFAAWWGVFPDIFAFAIPMIYIILGIISGSFDSAILRDTRSEEPPAVFQSDHPVFRLAPYLYNFSHSVVIFILVLGGLVLIKKFLHKSLMWKQLVPWKMLAWLGHIICDIPTHTPEFYPTPIFWPLSDWKFTYGFS